MFEFLFKYPAALFHKGQFVFLTPWPLWLLGVSIAAAAGLLFWHVRRNHGLLSGLKPLGIWLLESGLIALILLLLWHPALSVATLRPQQNVVAVLVDDSRSMGIRDENGATREAAAKAVLSDGLLKSLAGRFQVRIYRFGKDVERVPNLDGLNPTDPATRIGDTMERVLAESSSLPLGAIVVLSDGADNSGGLSLETVAAIRRARIPVHTVGFGKEHSERDTEVVDAVVAPRALPQSRLSAVVTIQSYGLSGTRAKLSVRAGGKVLAGQDVTLKGDGALQTETLVFNCGDAGAKTVEIGVDPLPGETNQANNRLARLVNVETRKPRILYMEGEPRWEYKFIRRSLPFLPGDNQADQEIMSMLRTTQNKMLMQGQKDAKELADGFPSKAEDLFAFQGLIIGSVEANYFSVTQQQLIRDFVDRRGGGVLFMGGRATLSDGGYVNSPLAELVPVNLLNTRPTFHRDFTGEQLTPEGSQSSICRLDDDAARNAERWKKMPQMANYQEVGDPKPGATVLLESTPPKRKFPLLVTQNYGRGRTVLFATEGSWRWKMWLPHDDHTQEIFWQQLLRYLVTDTPGQVVASTPKQVLDDETRLPLRVEVRDKAYKPVADAKVQARILEPDGASVTVELTPKPLEEGIYSGEWTADAPGSYVAEIIAGHEQEEIGQDVLSFRRENGIAENFRTGQNKELLQKLSNETGGRYYRPDQASKLGEEIAYSEAGITARETRDLWDMPAVFLLALGLKSAEWLLRRNWGVV
ncbi:MAG: glutamine amidotransferase [Bryobacteraceae bacterium]|jgi:uncharacterized membrane protein